MVARIVPFAIYVAFLALSGVLPDQGWDKRWLYGIQIALVVVALLWFWREYAELRDKTVSFSPLTTFITVLVGIIVFILWIRLNSGWMLMGSLSGGFDPRDSGQINVPLAAVRIFGAAIVVPIMEELFWRSLVMRWIDKPDFMSLAPAAITIKALLISSVVFGFEHVQWFAGVIAGIAYGWLYMRTSNLWMPIISHGVTNGLLGAWVLYSGSWHFW